MKLMRVPLGSLSVQTPSSTPLAFGAVLPVQQPKLLGARSATRAARAPTRLSVKQRGGNDEPDEPEEEVAVVKASIFALEALGKELDFFGLFQLKVFYLLVLQIGVLREDWLFVAGFLASLALLRRVQAPDGAALITAVLISGIFSPLFEGHNDNGFWANVLGTQELHPTSIAAAAVIGAVGLYSLVKNPPSTVDRELLPEEKDLLDIGIRTRRRELNRSELNSFDGKLNGTDVKDKQGAQQRDKRDDSSSGSSSGTKDKKRW